MKRKPETSEEWFKRRFPSADARRKADEAVDKLEVDRPMSEFIDTWIQAYKDAAGGRDGS